MSSRSCLDRDQKRPHKVRHRNDLDRRSVRVTNEDRRELLEQIRHLMEQTVTFVPDALYQQKSFENQLHRMRPASLDRQDEKPPSRPGLAFVTGLVDAPLLSPEEERYLFLRMNFHKYRAEQSRRKLDLKHPDRSLAEQILTDLNQATTIRNQIVMGNVRLIVALAKQIAGSVEQMSELISEGMLPLVRSVELFDVGKGNRFSTYATWAIRNQMIRLRKRHRDLQELVSMESSPSLENFPDKSPCQEPSDSVSQLRAATVSSLLESLSTRERAIVTARFGLEGQPARQSLSDISAQVGLSKERVRQILLSCLSKLRGLMSYDEFDALS